MFAPAYKHVIFDTYSEERWLVEQAKSVRKEQDERDAKGHRDKAVKYLLEAGLTYGTDFTADNAVLVANDRAYELEIARRSEEIGDGFIDFNGSCNCENCCGWNPKAHRCQCGNRRVCWVTATGFSFLQPDIYAEAY
jgi:hypothetical protein